MKRVMIINGGPRKKFNTSILLDEAAKGVRESGAETETIHLYDFEYKGCNSCFACKHKNATCKWKCTLKDHLSPILEKILSSDAVICGSPIYLGQVTGMTRCFLERLLFPLLSYEDSNRNFAGKIHSAFIYTMNLDYEEAIRRGYGYIFATNERYMRNLGGTFEQLIIGDTYQFDDYHKYAAARFDEKHKDHIRKTQFPIDRQKAFELGRKIVSGE
ncbi:MAG: flavodoxin family protein [Bacteroidales bacterium]|jgi:multimeric flavodoxin WrbA|nr:flavodoxin family protein [Bacteroidales bacterium]